MQHRVLLLDELGEKWGETHTFHNLRSPLEAVRLLCINYPDLMEYMATSHEEGVAYTVVQAGEQLGIEDLALPLGQHDLVIAPVVAGSGDVGKVVAGVFMIAAAVVFAPGIPLMTAGQGFMGAMGTGLMSAGVSSAVGWIGVSLVLGGVSNMLAPQPTPPKVPRMSSGESLSTDGPQSVTRGSDGKQSYAYTGAANTVGVGATVPVCYGKALCGSHLLSAEIEVSDESDPLRKYIKEPGIDTIQIGGDEVTGGFKRIDGLQTRSFKRYGKKGSGSAPGSQTIVLNKTFSLVEGSKTDLSAFKSYGSTGTHPANQYTVLFELPKGLYDYASGTGTTLVDGFITYRIEVLNIDRSGRPVVGSAQATIQGLLTKNQTYRWAHRFKFSHTEDDNNYKAYFSIIDFRGDKQVNKIKVLAHGFKMTFKN
jgi:predicted phage tail protein